MKRFLLIIMVLLLIASSATAEVEVHENPKTHKIEYYELQPGTYTIGEDFPMGKYDIRFNGLDKMVVVSYADEEALEPRSFTFTFSSEENWWNIGGFLVTLFPGTLSVEHSPIRLWTE